MKKRRWTAVIGGTLAVVMALVVMAGPLTTVAMAGGPGDDWFGLPQPPQGPQSPHTLGPLGTVADTLDMSVPRMLLALRFRYASIAELAEARGVDPEAVVQALVDEAATRLSHADNLTPEQANWILAQSERKATGFVYVEFPYGASIDVLQPAADAIGISVGELVNELEAGQTIAEVAQANGVDPAAVEQALIDYRANTLDEAVEVGLLTETQAAVLIDLYSSQVADIVNGDFRPGWGGGTPPSPAGTGPLAVVADELNMTVPQMLSALYTRYDSLADLAVVRRTSPEALVQALVGNAAEKLSQTDNLTQEQVAWILEQAERKARAFVYVEFPYGVAIDVLQPAADTIGIGVDALVDALQAGHTIADVAILNGVDPDTVEQAMIDYRGAIWDGAVQVGLLTETQADILLDLYSAAVPHIVTARWPNGQLLEYILDWLQS